MLMPPYFRHDADAVFFSDCCRRLPPFCRRAAAALPLCHAAIRRHFRFADASFTISRCSDAAMLRDAMMLMPLHDGAPLRRLLMFASRCADTLMMLIMLMPPCC